jgi:hypothetical protein
MRRHSGAILFLRTEHELYSILAGKDLCPENVQLVVGLLEQVTPRLIHLLV